MGSSASKAAQKGARRFPTRSPGTTPPPPQPPPRAAQRAAPPRQSSQPKASFTKDEAIAADAINPGWAANDDLVTGAFAARLKQMGVADPHPTFSPSSTATTSFPSPAPDLRSQQAPRVSNFPPSQPSAADNATLGVLEARRQLQERADREFEGTGRPGDAGREFLDVGTIRDALALRARGEAAADIEERLGLKRGVMARLGPPGVVSTVG